MGAPQTSTVKHVAIIMDGNGRWAKARNKPRVFGHKAGVKSVRCSVEHAAKLGLESLTLYAFSSENWNRPPTEVKLLFELLFLAINDQLADLHKNNIQLNILGDIQALPKRLIKKIGDATSLTKDNSGIKLNIALNYGARWEITEAAKQLANQVKLGLISVDEIDEARISEQLTTAGQPDLDLLIRTGGEVRLSNFLLWQAAYAELYFSDVHWPDFDALEFDKALSWFETRKRRFGQIDEQISAPK
ncbi:MAG: isoprenyl transferase [Arenicellales bacterium]